jgi:hypothetical protein
MRWRVNHAKVEGLGAAAMNGGMVTANKGNMAIQTTL